MSRHYALVAVLSTPSDESVAVAAPAVHSLPGLTKAQFLSPAAIDPTNRNHLVAAANDIKESTEGANTQVEFDPVTGTIVSSQWQESYALGATKVQNPTTGAPYDWQTTALAVRGSNIYGAICGACRVLRARRDGEGSS